MQNIRKVTNDIYYVGASNRRLSLFENVYPIPRGISYNSYVLVDDKTVLFDTADKIVELQFLENVEAALNGRNLDYIVVNHMEPDHCAVLEEIIRRYPDIKVVLNAKTVNMVKQFFDFDIDSRAVIIKEGDKLETGKHTLTFFMAPMVHWPEVMMTYDITEKILFSADAFGTFGAINGNLFSDEVDFEHEWLDDVRRYYTNIVGKYGGPVQTALKKASAYEIDIIAPLHGVLWKKDIIPELIEKYTKWATYTPEDKSVMIAYGSVYGNTQNAAEILASKLSEKGVKNIKLFDVSVTHPSYILSEAFRCSVLVFASATYNNGIFINMENLLHDIAAHCLQNRTVAFIQNGSWAPVAGKKMEEIISSLKGMNIIEKKVTIKSSLKEPQLKDIEELADAIVESLK
ncbi:MAG: FprA family A-type flavoprotein [Clostridia bacterium]|jgi:flavorubredoxin|nr:FprA family A-type flavoprotein [Clostridia bacterium]